MFRRRFIPYIIGVIIVALLSVSYVGYRAYQNHVEFKVLISESEVFQGSLDKDASHTVGGKVGPASANPESGVPDLLDKPPVKVRYAEASEIGEPSSEGYPVIHSEGKPWVAQFVETPDGTVRVVYTSPDKLIKEGDAIPPPPVDPFAQSDDGWHTIEAEEIPDHIPESEREAYVAKLIDAKTLGISIEELERQVASGELIIESAPLTPEDERMINAFLEVRGEGRLTDGGKQTPTGEGEYQQQISDATVSVSVEERGEVPAHSEASPVTDAPSGPIGAAHIHHGEENIHEPPAAESLKTQLKERLSPERFNKAQQLIDQYGSEEGLRRFRQMDPEAARQFESVPRPERERRPTPAREVPSETESSTQ